MNTQKTFALLLGIALVLIGILGFVDNPLVGDGGFFGTNTIQNILHIIAGLIGVWVGIKGMGPGYNMTLGWIGVVLGVLGFVPVVDDLLLTYLNINTEISVLHVVLGVITLVVYYGTSKE
ncbi:DUF4383 domain-containing protein [Candidatus Pacearchaeota archaeon]|nr:DUF4383 domain-containing protein [Candidatus Pacearchaeota archaeon]